MTKLKLFSIGAVGVALLSLTAHASNFNQFFTSAATSGSNIPSMISAESGSTMTVANGNLYCLGLNTANAGAGTVCAVNSMNVACGATQYNTGWRLPTEEELGLFLGYTGATADYLWTRSVIYLGGSGGFVIYQLSTGYWSNGAYNGAYYVRCVR